MTSFPKPAFFSFQGCTSDAGKSFLSLALIRHLANKGLKVVPFKAQNMSLNAKIADDGHEIAMAQYFQCLAAKCKPTTHNNPILIKPITESISQTLAHGKEVLKDNIWKNRKEILWPFVKESLDYLIHEEKPDVVVIEGAGSPAEINLRDSDIANMEVALYTNAKVVLISNIDRGGSFAHLWGTFNSLSKNEQNLIKYFILNKFRGDSRLLNSGIDWLKDKTNIDSISIPFVRHKICDEDRFIINSKPDSNKTNIGVVFYPYAANLDDIDPLLFEENINIINIKHPSDLDHCKAIILPGSRNTVKSLQYLRANKLDAAIQNFSLNNKLVFGICGGLQILGQEILDPNKIEGDNDYGLNLLDLKTIFDKNKLRTNTTIKDIILNLSLSGQEIRHGRSFITNNKTSVWHENQNGLIGAQKNNIWATYLHGVFENNNFRKIFLQKLNIQNSNENYLNLFNKELDYISDNIGKQLSKCFI